MTNTVTSSREHVEARDTQSAAELLDAFLFELLPPPVILRRPRAPEVSVAAPAPPPAVRAVPPPPPARAVAVPSPAASLREVPPLPPAIAVTVPSAPGNLWTDVVPRSVAHVTVSSMRAIYQSASFAMDVVSYIIGDQEESRGDGCKGFLIIGRGELDLQAAVAAVSVAEMVYAHKKETGRGELDLRAAFSAVSVAERVYAHKKETEMTKKLTDLSASKEKELSELEAHFQKLKDLYAAQKTVLGEKEEAIAAYEIERGSLPKIVKRGLSVAG